MYNKKTQLLKFNNFKEAVKFFEDNNLKGKIYSPLSTFILMEGSNKISKIMKILKSFLTFGLKKDLFNYFLKFIDNHFKFSLAVVNVVNKDLKLDINNYNCDYYNKKIDLNTIRLYEILLKSLNFTIYKDIIEISSQKIENINNFKDKLMKELFFFTFYIDNFNYIEYTAITNRSKKDLLIDINKFINDLSISRG